MHNTKSRLPALFDRMRRKLTLQYSGVLMVFLALFVIIVYVVLYLFIWNDQHSRLTKLADREIDILQRWVNQSAEPRRLPPRSVEDAFSISADQSFYYLIAENGSLQLGDEMQPQLRPQVMELIADGHFRAKKIEKIMLQTFDAPFQAEQADAARTGGEARFIVVDRDLLWHGERIGKLYVGKEVTFQHQLFRYLLILLVTVAILFFVLALSLSHYMSYKAVIPVAASYERQREFVADASHELRTPLSVLLTSIEALQMEAEEEKESAFASTVLGGMKAEVKSLVKLTEELLQLARSDSDGLEFKPVPFDVSEVAQVVKAKLLPLAQAKHITLDLRTPDEWKVVWDPDKLMSLLVLLIENAIKYTPDGGKVKVSFDPHTEKGQRMLVIEVEDNGVGIAPEALPFIFERFYRQDKARTRQLSGHGLGLAIAKSIVELGGGTIRVESAEGEGSRFTVHLPLEG